jgi:hypothetical protein
MTIPLFPNALDAASARGASELDNSSHPTNAMVDIATSVYIIVVTNIETIKALGITLVGFLVSSEILEIFSNP